MTEIARFAEVRPAAVRTIAGPGDVLAALALARERGLPIAVRGGGHSFAGWSVTTGVLLDTAPLTGIDLRGDRAVIGGGARLGPVYDALAAAGRTIPAGCGPTVGIAGLTLGGGLGILGRRYGLTCDALRAATVVLADGRQLTCDDEHETDLFWALRGGGAPGVVTALEFATVPEEPATGFLFRFPPDSAADVLTAWQRHTPEAPDTLAASLVLSTSADLARPAAVTVFGATGDPAAPAGLLGAIGVPPIEDSRHAGGSRAVKRWLSGIDPHDGPEPAGGHTYLKSEYFRAAVPAGELVARLVADRRPGESRELDFSPWGGAYCRVPAAATAFPHRDADFLLKHATTVDPAADHRPSRAWLASSFAITHPFGTGGVYPNFPEPDLPDTAYYGANAGRLRAIRAHYDPEGLFTPA